MKKNLAVIATLVLLMVPVAAAEESSQTHWLTEATSERKITRDDWGIAHITADDDLSAAYELGVVHAEDRLFQMDLLRRQASGRLAELLGSSALPSDVQFRTLGLRRAADETAPVLDATTMAWLQAYADGVNAVLDDTDQPLPPEYADLELTRTSIPAWTPVDSLTVLKLLVFGWSFDLSDLDRSLTIAQYEAAGSGSGFDGEALFYEDLFRSAPFAPATSAEGASVVEAERAEAPDVPDYIRRSSPLLEETVDRLSEVPLLEQALEGSAGERGSNWWILSGDITASGRPILASDPHLSLNMPAFFHQVSIEVTADTDPEMRVSGVTLPGIPAVLHGCNPRGCWAGARDPADVTDVYLEEVVIDSGTGLPTHTTFDGSLEPVDTISQSFMVNQVGDSTDDNLVEAGSGSGVPAETILVPRRNNGPIIEIDTDDSTAISVQYTGSGATREIEALLGFRRAYTVDQFHDALASWDTGSQAWAWADIDGTIAWFASGEIPLREDLQELGTADGGVPPFLLRDGTGARFHEWVPATSVDPTRSIDFEVLPAAELPSAVDPAKGWLAAANNDLLGLTFDNDPLNETRPDGGVFYLGRTWAPGLRAKRILGRIEAELAGGGKISMDEARAIQADNVLEDALFFVPYITDAWERLGDTWPGADAAAMAEAVGRLAAWDGSTPTGIQPGYDPGDDPNDLQAPTAAEVDASVAATIYAVWRERIISLTIDDALDGAGGLPRPGSVDSLKALAHLFAGFPGNGGSGASGLELIPGGDLDGVVLSALSESLAALASPAMDDAFGGSTDQSDYRWGRLHRIVLDHPLGGANSVPPAGGFSSLGARLPGLARSGGFLTVDQASHSARADSSNEFMFGSGAARRFVAELSPDGIETCDVVPGGVSGIMSDPHATDQLPFWLTHGCRGQPLFQNFSVATVSSLGLVGMMLLILSVVVVGVGRIR
ncbi:penicillin acylase family protein [Wenzhouxiangella sp. EGI_FJ10305]|uniref:penicillin acylase family protein n=1 Tax=Wenzhouxiangella sp. EGI_FJ10305 TaxID=3243768 RepID=UPI0035E234B7